MRCEPLPIAPGEGPFRGRGIIFKGILDYVEARTPGGLAAVRGALGDPALGAYFDRIFLASASYDLGPLIHLVRVAARREGVGLAAFIRERARSSARIDVPGVYAPVLKTASVEAMAARLPRIFSRYFEPVVVEVVECAPGRLCCRFTGLPEPMVGWYAWSNEGFMAQSLTLAGARAPRVATVEEVADGALDGIPLRALTQLATW